MVKNKNTKIVKSLKSTKFLPKKNLRSKKVSSSKVLIKRNAIKRTNKTKSKKLTKTSKKNSLMSKWFIATACFAVIIGVAGYLVNRHQQQETLSGFTAQPYNIVKPLAQPAASPSSLILPSTVKAIYNISSTSLGKGTIAIIDAYDDPRAESDLANFDKQYNLPSCTTANGCFEKHQMVTSTLTDPTWNIEVALDVEWAHAIAPSAKILLVESKSPTGLDLMSAINYTRNRNDVADISMSWGGNEFSAETIYESSFTSKYGARFFAASGDSGHGTSWPSVSANVISVGGTSLKLNSNGTFASEVAWPGSGGGSSSYINEPLRQINSHVPQALSHRATPDVSYNADPNNGYPVYDSNTFNGSSGWFQVGGTSAGTPQWAAIANISGNTFSSDKLYSDAAKPNQKYFRDITIGSNGTCAYYCSSRIGFDYVTGLGTPLTYSY